MKFNFSYMRNGVPQTIFVEADNEDVARKYFMEKKPDAEIAGVHEANRDDERPGKPVMTVPSDYEHGLMNVYDYTTPWGGTDRVMPKIDMYSNNNNLYVGLDYFDADCGAWLPYTDVTVNVGDLPYLCSAIDTNNNGKDIIDFLVKNGFGELTGASIPSGFCMFPVFRFNEDKLKEIGSTEFELYARAHGRDVKPSLDEKISEAGKVAVSTKSPDRIEPNKEIDR